MSSFQALAISLSGRVGIGNIAGVATAIAFGGPGAVFWMWVMAFFGASTSYIESTLAQIYKEKDDDGRYRGGPAYFIDKAMGQKWYAWLFAVVTIVAFVNLGFWQLRRHDEKVQLRDAVAAAQAMDPIPILEAPAGSYRRVTASGTFDGSLQTRVLRSQAGVSGYHVLTPFLLGDGTAVLVDRGWISLDAEMPQPFGRVTEIEGTLWPAEEGSGIPAALTPAVRRHLEERLARIERYAKVSEARVVLDAQKGRHVTEIVVHVKGKELVAREESHDALGSIEAAVERLERQVKRAKEKRTAQALRDGLSGAHRGLGRRRARTSARRCSRRRPGRSGSSPHPRPRSPSRTPLRGS